MRMERIIVILTGFCLSSQLLKFSAESQFAFMCEDASLPPPFQPCEHLNALNARWSYFFKYYQSEHRNSLVPIVFDVPFISDFAIPSDVLLPVSLILLKVPNKTSASTSYLSMTIELNESRNRAISDLGNLDADFRDHSWQRRKKAARRREPTIRKSWIITPYRAVCIGAKPSILAAARAQGTGRGQTAPPGIRNRLEHRIETYVTVMCKRWAEFCATNRTKSIAEPLPNATRVFSVGDRSSTR